MKKIIMAVSLAVSSYAGAALATTVQPPIDTTPPTRGYVDPAPSEQPRGYVDQGPGGDRGYMDPGTGGGRGYDDVGSGHSGGGYWDTDTGGGGGFYMD